MVKLTEIPTFIQFLTNPSQIPQIFQNEDFFATNFTKICVCGSRAEFCQQFPMSVRPVEVTVHFVISRATGWVYIIKSGRRLTLG